MSVLGAELDQENAAYMVVGSAGMFGWCLWATLMFFEFPVWASVLIELVMFIGSFAFMIRRWNKQVRAEEEAEHERAEDLGKVLPHLRIALVVRSLHPLLALADARR